LKLDGKILIHKNVGKFVGMPMDALIPLAIRFIAFKFSSYIDSMNSLKTPIDNIKKRFKVRMLSGVTLVSIKEAQKCASVLRGH